MPRSLEYIPRKIEISPSRINWSSYENSYYGNIERKKESSKNKKFLFALIAAVIFSSIIFFLFFNEVAISGHVISLEKTAFMQGEELRGSLDLSLREGEFLPKETIARIYFDDNIKTLALDEFIQQSGANLQESYGNYFFTRAEISGAGQGYGWRGIKVDYIPVFFQLEPEVFAIQEESPSFSRIDGSLKYGEELVQDGIYNLVPGSVRTSDGQLSDDAIILRKENGKTIISTDYHSTTSGYGQEFLGDEHAISFNLSELHWAVGQGKHTLLAEFSYNDQILVSESAQIEASSQSLEEQAPEMPVAEMPSQISEEPFQIGIQEASANPICGQSDTQGIISYWKADNSYNDTMGLNNGTVVGTVPFVTGKIGNAFDVRTSTKSYVDIADTNFPTGNSPRTLMAWAKLNGNNRAILFLYGTATDKQMFGVNLDPIYIQGLGTQGYNFNVEKATPISLTDWVNIAVSFNSSTIFFYVNGTLVLNTTVTTYLPGLQLSTMNTVRGADHGIGSSPAGFVHVGNATIDEIIFLNRSLNSSEIYDLYNRTNNGNAYCILSSSIYPTLNFTSPTLSSGTKTSTKEAIINVSISSFNRLNEFKFNWNGTNYTLYNDSLVLMMNFDNLSALGESSTIVKDLSKHGNNGTVTNAQFTAGKFGGAYEFAGLSGASNTYIKGVIGPSLNFSKEITISAWVKRKSNQQYQTVFARRTALTGIDYQFEFAGSINKIKLFMVGISDNWETNCSNTAVPLDTWTHIAAAWNGSELKYYYNGNPDGTFLESGTLQTKYNNFFIGIQSDGAESQWPFNGTIDELRVWNRSLSDNEVKQIYQSNLQKFNQTQWYFYSNQSNLTDQTYTYSASAKDASGNENQTEKRNITIQSDVDNPLINFTSPTPASGTKTSTKDAIINVSIVEANLNEFKFNWNGTNYTLYNDSLLLMMNFNNNSALGETSTKAVDSSKYSNNGTFIRNAVWNSSGKYGSGVSLAGNPALPDYVNISNKDLFNFVKENITIESWVKFNGLSGNQGFVGKDSSTPWSGYGYRFESNGIMVHLLGTGVSAYTGALSWSTGQWYHVAFTYDHQNIKIYRDGALVKTQAASADMIQNTASLVIGGFYGDSAGEPLNGTIDEVRIWNRSLSENEINQSYSSNLQKFNSTQWYFYSNQSNLAYTTYTYSASAKDANGYENQTETRSITIQTDADNPLINFTSPTPASGTATTAKEAIINVSISEANLNEFKFNWNGTNYTFYNNALRSMMNFNNRSVLGENSTYAVDASPYSINATFRNGALLSPGKYGNSLYVDGTDDYAEMPDADFDWIQYGQPFTISCWIKNNHSSQSIEDGIISKQKGSSVYEGWRLGERSDGRITFSTWKTYSTAILGTDWNVGGVGWFSMFNNTGWHHLTLTYNGNTSAGKVAIGDFSLYVDGVNQDAYRHVNAGENAGTVNSFTSDVTAKVGYVRGSWYYKGNIDEVAIFNRSLSTAEISQLYQSNLQKYNSTQWYFYSNQSNLSYTTYTYSASAKDSYGNENQTELRTLNITAPDTTPPLINFTSPTPASGTKTAAKEAIINVSVSESSLGEFKFNWNGTNTTFYNDSLVLMMNFDNNSALGENSTYFVDSSKYSYNGTSSGTSYPSISTGRYGSSISFDGTDDYVSFGNPPINFTKPYSISFWLNRTVGSGQDIIISRYSSDTNRSFYYRFTGSSDPATMETAVYYDATNACDYSSVTGFTAGNWYHVVAMWNGTTLINYINGAYDSSMVCSNVYMGTYSLLELGARSAFRGGGREDFLTGKLDNVQIWNRSLSASEISQLYKSNLQKYNSTQWYFYSNQSNLSYTTYTYSASAKDAAGNENQTETRSITIQSDIDNPLIEFKSPTLASGAKTSAKEAILNVSVSEANLNEFKFSWNGTNNTVYNDSLLLMMNFDNLSSLGENATFVVDNSKYSNNGTVNNSIWNSSGKYGGAYSFSGGTFGTNFIKLSPANFNFTNNSFTFSLWAYKRGTKDYQMFLSKRNPYNTIDYVYGLVSEKPGMYLTPMDTTWTKNANTAVPLNSWTYLAVTWNSTTVQYYFNGIKDGNYSINGTLQTLGTEFIIGAMGSGLSEATYVFNGSIDEVRVWNRSLSENEVKQQYYSNLQKFNQTQWYFYSNQSNLSDTTYTYSASAKDSSGNENQTETRTLDVDSTNPLISIVYPTSSTYSSNVSSLNYTVSDANIQACWYSLDLGVTNTSINCGANITGLASLEGSNTWRVWANDSAGNQNSSSVTFTKDTIGPPISFVSPTLASGSKTSAKEAIINVSVSEANLNEFKFNWNLTNYTFYNDSLVLMYNFDNLSLLGENSTNFVDVSKYSNNGTCSGTGCPALNSGKYGSTLKFDGSNDVMTINNGLITNFTRSYSISFWINRTAGSGQDVIIARYGSDTNNSFYYRFNGANDPAVIETEAWYDATHACGYNSIGGLTAGKWHYVVFMWNGTTLINYIDGNYDSSMVCSNVYMGTYSLLEVGSRGFYVGGADFLTGSIDELRIWNRTLTGNEIKQQYYSNLQKFNSTQWYFYSNQSNLSYTTYTYSASAKDVSGNENQTETRTIEIINLTYSAFANNLTTDFSTVSNISAVPNATIGVSGKGLINFSGKILDFNNLNLDTNINISQNYIYLNSTVLSGLNTSAILTIYNVSFNTEVIRVRDEGQDWRRCYDCYIISSGVNVTFNVTHFSAYSVGENSSLNVSDDTDSVKKAINQQIKFYANYTNATSAITGANCSVKFNLTGAWEGLANMTYNSTSKLYEYNRTFSSVGNFYFNAQCNGTSLGYDILNATDSFIVYLETDNPLPDFTPPTLSSGAKTSLKDVLINVSILEANLNEFKFNWNGTNYTIYNDSLVLMMNFNNNSALGENATYAVDVSKYSNNGTCSGTSCPAWNSSERFGGAMKFDGTNDYINITNEQNFDFEYNAQFSMSVWYKFPAAPITAANDILAKTGGGTRGYLFRLDGYVSQQVNPAFVLMNDVSTTGKRISTYANFDFKNFNNTWVHVAVVYDGSGSYTGFKFYINSVEYAPVGIGGFMTCDATTATDYNLIIGGQTSGTLNGSIDELRIWNRSLSASEIKQQYYSNLQKFNSTQWYFYSNQSNLSDGTYTYSASAKDTSGNYNSTETRNITIETIAPTIVFLSQTPIDINVTNLQSNPLRINYSITDNTAVNTSTVKLYYKSNSTLSNVHYYLNGTAHSGYFSADYLSNISSNFSWRLLDNEAYPGTYNIGPVTIDNLAHTAVLASTNNYYVKTEYYNISNSSQWGIFEIMTNSTAAAAPSSAYYCNSSYVSGKVSTSPYCALLSTKTATTTFSHCHLNSSCHNWFQFSINTTSGKIGTVAVTSTSYFLFGTSDQNWYVYNVSQQVRAGMTQVATNANSNNWATQAYTVDEHVHQFPAVTKGNSTFYYYVCANDTVGNSNCSEVRSDLLELAGLPPTSPNVLSPTEGVYLGNILINYTASESPNEYAISFYNISLLNSDGITFNKTIRTNNSLNLSYVWNSSGTSDGTYRIRVQACDILSQCSYGYSENFTIDSTNPLISIVYPTSSTYSSNVSSLNYTVSDANIQACWYSLNSGTTNTSINCGANITGLASLEGSNTWKVWANDSAGNQNSSSVTFTKDTIGPPISFVSPTPASGIKTTNTSVQINISISEPIINEFKFNWNQTNTTFYDASLKLMLNFENLSSLGENATLAADLSKYSNNATCSGTSCPAWNSLGRFGGAYQFDGNNDAFNLNRPWNFTASDNITIAFWIKPSDISTFQKIMGISPDWAWAFYQNTGTLTFVNWDASSNDNIVLQNASVLSNNVWTFIAVTYENSSNLAKLYVNDKIFNSKSPIYPGNFKQSSDSLKIGDAYNWGGPTTFNGYLDEIRFYYTALSASEISQLYKSNLQKFNSTQWYFYSNQSNLSYTTYTYSASAKDSYLNENQTETRNITIQADVDSPLIEFKSPTLASGAKTSLKDALINVSISEANLNEFKFNWNGTNYTFYNDSLVLMMNFDNNSVLGENATLVADLSKYGTNGNCSGTNCPTWNLSGRYGGAYQFDGVNDYINLGDQASMKPTAAITIAAWVYPKKFGAEDAVFEMVLGEGTLLRYVDDVSKRPIVRGQIHSDINGWIWANGNTNLTQNAWNFIAMTYDGSYIRAYLNGNLDCTPVAATGNMVWTPGDTIRIGHSDQGGAYTNGSIDELRVWSRSLSDAEIKQQYYSNLQKYNSTQWYFYSNQSNLSVGTYTYSASAKDVSGNENQTEARTLEIQSPSVIPTCGNGSTAGIQGYWGGNSSPKDSVSGMDISTLGGATYVSGIVGNGFKCSGSAFMQVQNSNLNAWAKAAKPQITMEFWLNLTDVNTRSIFMGDYGNSYYTFGPDYYNGSASTPPIHILTSYLNGPTPNLWNYVESGVINASQWYHYALTYNGSYITNYLNGVQVGTPIARTGNIGASSTGSYISMCGYADYVKGVADEIALYNRSLSASEIQQHYINGINGDPYCTPVPDTTSPLISITYPANITYTSNVSSLNYTVYDANIQACWYSLNSGTTNTSINCGANITGLASLEGSNTWKVWANDSAGNTNSSSVTFTKDTIGPALSFVSPTLSSGSKTSAKEAIINVSISEANLNEFKFNWNGTNYTSYDSSLKLMMNFENKSSLGENATLIVDLSKYANNGIAINGAYWNSSGKYGGAYQFDGVDDYSTINDFADVGNSQKEISVFLWIKGPAQAYKFPIGHYDVNSQSSWLIASGNVADSDRDTSVFRIQLTDDGGWADGHRKIARSNITVFDNQWHFIGFTFNNGAVNFYVDGINDSTLAFTYNDPITTLWDSTGKVSLGTIMAGSSPYGNYFNGSIDELRIYNRSLNASEIQQQYYSNLQKFNSTQWYFYSNQSNLSETTYTYSASAKDASGNENQTETRSITIDLTAPSINFTSPTPESGIQTFSRNHVINISVSESSLGEFKFILNSVNTTFYDDSLKFMMSFENKSIFGENSTYFVDLSKYSNNGTCTANCPIVNQTGKYGKGMQFNRGSGINVPNSPSINMAGSNKFTISAWINPGVQNGIIARKMSNPGNYYQLYLEGGLNPTVNCYFNGWTNDNSNIAANQWHHVVCMYDGTYRRLYIDGIQVDADNIGSQTIADTSSEYLMIGKTSADPTDYAFNGTIDELMIWNKSFSADEVKQLYQSNLQKYNQTKWQFYSYQQNLVNGTYTYLASAKDSLGNENLTETRNLTVLLIKWGNFTNQWTTNFSLESNMSAVQNATVGNEYGLINWTGKTLDFGYIDLDANINISQNYIYLNSTAMPSLNQSSILHLYNLPYNQVSIRVKDDGDSAWRRCTECSVISYSGGNVTFNISHFSAYSAGENASLTISDDTDTLSKNIHEIVKFYANYSDSDSPIIGANCSIKFNLTGSWGSSANMTYNPSTLLYGYSKTFQYDGIFEFNVLCDGYSLGYDILNATDSFTIGSSFVNPNLVCSIESSQTCSSGTALLRLKNDSGGYENAHMQHVNAAGYDAGTEIYNNTLCCSSNYQIVSSGATVSTSFLKLSNYTNAHSENPLYSNYTYPVSFGVIDSTPPILDVGCTLASGSCAEGYTCLLSVASSEEDNLTNQHAGSCASYDTKVCCIISQDTPPTVALTNPADNYYTKYSSQDFNCTSADSKALSSVTLYVIDSSNSTVVDTTIGISGTSNDTTFSATLPNDDVYKWTCKVTDSAAQSAWAISNRTITRDMTAPLISFADPTEISGSVLNKSNIQVNVTAYDLNFANITINLYNETEVINSQSSTSTSLYYNFMSSGNGLYYFNATACDIAGNCYSTETRYVTINTSLTIPFVSFINSTDPNEDSTRTVDFSFTAHHEGGTSMINSSSAYASFIKGSVERNNSCSYVGDISSTDANYSCSIGMWYFDEPGQWTVSVSISDNTGFKVYNLTTSFTYNELIAFVMSPDSLYWNTITRGSSNQLPASGNYSILRNTGNKDIPDGGVKINASNLVGTLDSSYIIPAENFTASGTQPGVCLSGMRLSNTSEIGIYGAPLPKGNQSTANIYYCLVETSFDLIKQTYSSSQSWTIRIVAMLALIVPARRKKRELKRKILQELDKELSIRKISIEDMPSMIESLKENRITSKDIESFVRMKGKISVPVSIFRNDLGPLESLVKHLKENMKMGLSEIADLLNRDERTIWTTYQNAVSKKKSAVSAEDRKVMIPLAILYNRGLSVLENIVLYLRNSGKTNAEIARILGRDPRNIYTLFTRAMKKSAVTEK